MENNNPVSTPQNDTVVTAAPQEASAPVVDTSAPAAEPAQATAPQVTQQPYNPYQPVLQSTQTVAGQQPYNPYQSVPDPVQTAAPQQPYTYQPTAPVQTAAPQPVQTAAPQQSANPYQASYSYAPSAVATTNKRSVGKIIALVIGIILTVLGAFWLLATIMVYVSEFNTYGEVEISIPVVIIFSLPLIIGIVLTVFGAKKSKQVTPVASPYSAPQPTAYTAANTYAPTTVPTAVPTSAPVSTPVSTPVAADATAPTVSEQITAPTIQTTAAPSAPTFNQAGQTAAPTPVSGASTYQYAPTVTIQDDSQELSKKNARKNGLIAIAIVVVMWLILLLTGYIFWYLLIIPIIMAVTALKNNIKSIAGWASLALSILSVILFIVVLISLA